jgi:hypothetical protein
MVALCVVWMMGCWTSSRQWVAANPRDAPAGGEMFVTVGENAIHLRSIQRQDQFLFGHVVDAWVVPAGAGNLTDNEATPAQVANHAGWSRSTLIPHGSLKLDLAQIRSAQIPVATKHADYDSGARGAAIWLLIVGVPIVLIAFCAERCRLWTVR